MEGLHVNLIAARLVCRVGDPVPIGGKAVAAFVERRLEISASDCLFTDLRFEKISNVTHACVGLFSKQGLAIRRPAVQMLMPCSGEKLLFGTTTIGVFPERETRLPAR